MLNIQIHKQEEPRFIFSGDKPVEAFEYDGISLYYWGNIENVAEISKLLATESDTQLVSPTAIQCLYHAYRHWGMGLTTHIQGAYGFVLYDNHKDMLLMARDKLGLARVYYTVIEGTYHIAPDLLSLCKKYKTIRLNEAFIQHYICCGFTPPPETLMENIYTVPAASWIQAKEDNTIKTHTYWYPINNSYAIRKEDIPSFEAALQAVKNKLGNTTITVETSTPKVLFNNLKEQEMTHPIGNLSDLVTPQQNLSGLFSPVKPQSFWQKLWHFKQQPFSPATLDEEQVAELISPFIRRKQVTVEQTLTTLKEDFQHQPEQKKTDSNWVRNVYLSFILPEKLTAFGTPSPLLKTDLIELCIGLPERISLQIPETLEILKSPAPQPLEEWFFERYKQESWQLVERFCRETELLNLHSTEEAWQAGNLELNWRLTSLALWWQVAIKREETFIQ